MTDLPLTDHRILALTDALAAMHRRATEAEERHANEEILPGVHAHTANARAEAAESEAADLRAKLTAAESRASMLTAMSEVGRLVGLVAPADKTDREAWNVFGNCVGEEVKARLAAGEEAERLRREAIDRVVSSYAEGRADAIRAAESRAAELERDLADLYAANARLAAAVAGSAVVSKDAAARTAERDSARAEVASLKAERDLLQRKADAARLSCEDTEGALKLARSEHAAVIDRLAEARADAKTARDGRDAFVDAVVAELGAEGSTADVLASIRALLADRAKIRADRDEWCAKAEAASLAVSGERGAWQAATCFVSAESFLAHRHAQERAAEAQRKAQPGAVVAGPVKWTWDESKRVARASTGLLVMEATRRGGWMVTARCGDEPTWTTLHAHFASAVDADDSADNLASAKAAAFVFALSLNGATVAPVSGEPVAWALLHDGDIAGLTADSGDVDEWRKEIADEPRTPSEVVPLYRATSQPAGEASDPKSIIAAGKHDDAVCVTCEVKGMPCRCMLRAGFPTGDRLMAEYMLNAKAKAGASAEAMGVRAVACLVWQEAHRSIGRSHGRSPAPSSEPPRVEGFDLSAIEWGGGSGHATTIVNGWRLHAYEDGTWGASIDKAGRAGDLVSAKAAVVAFVTGRSVASKPGDAPVEKPAPAGEASDEELVDLYDEAFARCGGDFGESVRAALRAVYNLSRGQASQVARFDFASFADDKSAWSERTFGPGARTAGVIDHIRKELREIERDPADVSEWVDVIILAMDGAWRSSGASGAKLVEALVAKMEKNKARTWPDWRTMPADKAIEHDRSGEAVEKPAPDGLGPCGDCAVEYGCFDGSRPCSKAAAPVVEVAPTERYVVVERDEVKGRRAAGLIDSGHATRLCRKLNDGEVADRHVVWEVDERDDFAIIDTHAPAPKPTEAPSVDPAALAEAIEASLTTRTASGAEWASESRVSWSSLSETGRRRVVDAALATVGARPAKVLTEEMLATARALCCGPGSTATADDRRWAKEAMHHLGPVALPTLDVEALRWARSYCSMSGATSEPDTLAGRALAALDAILAADGTVTP